MEKKIEKEIETMKKIVEWAKKIYGPNHNLTLNKEIEIKYEKTFK